MNEKERTPQEIARRNGNESAAPISNAQSDWEWCGLTKREQFAAQAMLALLSTGLPKVETYGDAMRNLKNYAITAVSAADALLLALEEVTP